MAKNKPSPQSEEQSPTTLLLIRHGENEWTRTRKLAGRMPGVHLNKQGKRQAKALGKRLATVKLEAIYASPLERTLETAQIIAAHHSLEIKTRPGLLEVDYGEWTGQKIKKIAQEPAWQVAHFYPSGAELPGGETMYGMQTRFVQELNTLVAQHPGQTIAVVGHGDPIKAAVAHYLGIPFDLFQRLVISTASITTITFTPLGPRIMMVNDTYHNPPPVEKGQYGKSS
jgi:probable phosphoglycerate mutase